MPQCDEMIRKSLKPRVAVYIMIGVAGSGKSTAAKKLAEETGAEIFSSDAIRAELYGDESIQGNNKEVFDILYRRAVYEASFGCPVIIDATGLTKKTRRFTMNAFRNLNAEFIAVFVNTPLEKALAQNANRVRVVPDEVINRHFAQLVKPTLEEGFSKIIEIQY